MMTSRLLILSSGRKVTISPPRLLWDVRFLSTRPERSKVATVDTTSILNSAAGFFSMMRWKAATALTASLPEKERRQLLDSLYQNGIPPKPLPLETKDIAAPVVTDLEMKNSIAEAVAAARAEESRRHAEKWEREKEALLLEAQAAATARIESDLAIQKRRLAFEQWKEQVEAEKKALSNSPPANAVLLKDTIATETVIADSEPSNQTLAVPVENAVTIEPHPILGACLLDLGYKRVHVVSASALAAIPVWKEQRIYRHDRAKAMAADKLKTMHLGMPGVIGLYEDTQGRLSILDGQHRVGMFTILASKQKDGADGMLDRILVEVYPQLDHHDEAHAQDIFLEINKAEPIKLVDMPGIAKVGDRKILLDATESLYEKYPDMFSASQKCRPPHLNRDNLRDALFAANVIARHEIKSSKQLEEWILQQNELLVAQFAADPKTAAHVPKTALDKSHKFRFYLGVNSTWYFN
jgi:hypothetical protein